MNKNLNINIMSDKKIDALNKVGKSIINRLNEMNSIINYECPVCYENTELNSYMIRICGHIFCAECVHELPNNLCGICRSKFTPKTGLIHIKDILQSELISKKHKNELECIKNEANQVSKINETKFTAQDRINYDKYIKKYINKSYLKK
mmetsp:Transcript_42743/g.52577  ORF Transcript_42743/g.52577 Transcript_42743/m.52577 type:complete len:149 (-) Transcript_42743:13-459(-)